MSVIRFLRTAAALVGLLFFAAAPLRAQQQELKIGVGFGIGFLPAFIADELKLVEKHAKAEGLDLKASYPRFSGSSAMQVAVLSGSVDVGIYGLQAVLLGWEKTKGSSQQLVGLAGITTQPQDLLTNRPNIKTIADFQPSDRIAMPAAAGPTMYILQMAAEKAFGRGNHKRLDGLVVELPHPEALRALVAGTTEVTAYFGSPPFTQIALRDPKVARVLTSTDVYGGKASFLVACALKRTLDANPKAPMVLISALDEAISVIKADPARAAEIYLKLEPSKSLDLVGATELVRDLKDDFGTDVHAVASNAEFMARVGALKRPLANWREVFPYLAERSSD